MKYFKKGIAYFTFKYQNHITKIDETRLIAKQSNASIIAIRESKLDSSILNSETDVGDYDLIRMNRSRRGGKVACHIRKLLSYNHKSSFCPNTDRHYRHL